MATLDHDTALRLPAADLEHPSTSSDRTEQKDTLLARGWSRVDAEAGAIAAHPIARSPGDRRLEQVIRSHSRTVAAALNPESYLTEHERREVVYDALFGYGARCGAVGRQLYGDQYLVAAAAMSVAPDDEAAPLRHEPAPVGQPSAAAAADGPSGSSRADGLRLPNETSPPTDAALALLAPYNVGEIIDSGPVTSAWSTGEIVVTDLGVALVDPVAKHVVGVAWVDFELETVDDPITSRVDVEIRFSIDGVDFIDLRIDRLLFENIERAAAFMTHRPAASPAGKRVDPGLTSPKRPVGPDAMPLRPAGNVPDRKPCPECSQQSRHGDKFCRQCGTSLSPRTVEDRRFWRPFRR